MAIKYQDLKNNLENDPLTETELSIIREVEEWIDEEIKATFGKSYYESWIDKSIVTFNHNPVTNKHIETKEPRRRAMSDELEKRYKKAGWKITWPDDIDNLYVKFSGK